VQKGHGRLGIDMAHNGCLPQLSGEESNKHRAVGPQPPRGSHGPRGPGQYGVPYLSRVIPSRRDNVNAAKWSRSRSAPPGYGDKGLNHSLHVVPHDMHTVRVQRGGGSHGESNTIANHDSDPETTRDPLSRHSPSPARVEGKVSPLSALHSLRHFRP
jgi:hypothetical protein